MVEVRESFCQVTVAVMVDEATASAAEALILRLLDAKRRGEAAAVTVVGARGAKKTFGKGVSQQTFELSDGSAVMVTVSRWASDGFTGVTADVTLSEREGGRVRKRQSGRGVKRGAGRDRARKGASFDVAAQAGRIAVHELMCSESVRGM
mmetsp:Transcript_39030/g.78790  ORF Transcript_39030/g.78790 Transcript_39030/m.78790 type:complete len:150 (+) Transcript_39030:424-873(+)